MPPMLQAVDWASDPAPANQPLPSMVSGWLVVGSVDCEHFLERTFDVMSPRHRGEHEERIEVITGG